MHLFTRDGPYGLDKKILPLRIYNNSEPKDEVFCHAKQPSLCELGALCRSDGCCELRRFLVMLFYYKLKHSQLVGWRGFHSDPWKLTEGLHDRRMEVTRWWYLEGKDVWIGLGEQQVRHVLFILLQPRLIHVRSRSTLRQRNNTYKLSHQNSSMKCGIYQAGLSICTSER